MKKLFIVLAVFTGGILSANAQDLIILRDGNVIESQVVEISPTEIRYRRFDHLEGPIIVVPAANVMSIRFANGMVQIITAAPAAAPVTAQAARASRHPSFYALDPNRLAFGLSLDVGAIANYALALDFQFTRNRFNAQLNLLAGFSFGGGLAINYFHHTRLGGFYVGGIVEYSFASFIVGLNIGYKFVTPSGVFFRTGAALGYGWNLFSAGFAFRPALTFGYNFQRN